MTDFYSEQMFGDAAAEDPYEGLPPHMREGVPHQVVVEVGYSLEDATRFLGATKVGDYRDGLFWARTPVRAERNGLELNVADRPPSWRAGEKGDYRW